MNFLKKAFTLILVFLIIPVNTANTDDLPDGNESEIYKFGKKSDHVLVLTSSKTMTGKDTNMIKQLRKVISFLERQTPEYTVIVAFTANDCSDLPSDVPVKLNSGTKLLISEISQYLNAAVLVFEDTDKNTEIISGANGMVSPDWLLSDLYSQLSDDEKKSAYHSFRIYSQKLNLITPESLLAEYLKKSIPAIKLYSNADVFELCKSLIENYTNGYPENRDKNYFAFPFNKIYIISEHILIYVAIAIIFFSLFMLFIFIFSKSLKFKNIDLLKAFLISVAFFLINTVSLFISRKLIFFFLTIRFGSLKIISLFPQITVLIYVLVSGALILLSNYFLIQNLKKLKINISVLESIQPIISLINIFLFSFFEFLLYPIFFMAYIFSIIYAKTKNIITKWCFLTFMTFPFIILFILIKKDWLTIALLMFNFNYFFLAFLLLPVSIGIAINLNLKPKSKRIKNIKVKNKYAPVFILSFFIFAGILTLLFIKPYSKKRPLPVYIRQTINDVNVENKIISDFKRETNTYSVTGSNSNKTSNEYLTVKTDIENYLERTIAQIIITSSLNIETLEITIENKNGFAVFESDKFIYNKSGNIAKFITKPKPEIPIELNFSSEENATLNITVRAWTYDNPLNTKIKKNKNKFFNETFLLELKRNLVLKHQTGT